MAGRKKNAAESSRSTVKCWLMDRDYNPILADHISAPCLDISAEGMVLEWPVSWKCKGCPYNEKNAGGPHCSAHKCPFEDTSRFLVEATMMKVFIKEKKMERYAKVAWVKEKENCCHIGVSFSS